MLYLPPLGKLSEGFDSNGIVKLKKRAKVKDDSTGGTSTVSAASENLPVDVSSSDNPKYFTSEELLEDLCQRGFADAHTDAARQLLERVSYRHLMPYISAVEKGGEKRALKSVHDLLTLDRRFQAAVFKYIGVFEMQLRVSYSDAMAKSHGAFALYDAGLFHRACIYNDSIAIHKKEIERKARHSKPIERALDRYGGKLPIWYSVELMTLGTLSKFYSNTKDGDVAASVPRAFGVTKHQLSSWLKTIAEARNAFAHFDPYIVRRQIPAVPLPIRELSMPNVSPLYLVVLLYRILDSPSVVADPNTHYAQRLRSDVISVLDSFYGAHGDSLVVPGVPDDWRALLSFWDTLVM